MKKKYIFILLIFNNVLHSQILIDASYGYNFDFGKEISSNYKSINNLDINFKYRNENGFSPSLSVIFTSIPLNYSNSIIKNQHNYNTIVINNSTSLKIGLETLLKDFYKSRILLKFGLGLNFFSNPLVWVENSNTSYGFNTTYNKNKANNNFAFIDLSTSIERNIFNKCLIHFDIGTQYYPKDNFISINTEFNNQNVEINSTFTKLRPYTKFGIIYILSKN